MLNTCFRTFRATHTCISGLLRVLFEMPNFSRDELGPLIFGNDLGVKLRLINSLQRKRLLKRNVNCANCRNAMHLISHSQNGNGYICWVTAVCIDTRIRQFQYRRGNVLSCFCSYTSSVNCFSKKCLRYRRTSSVRVQSYFARSRISLGRQLHFLWQWAQKD